MHEKISNIPNQNNFSSELVYLLLKVINNFTWKINYLANSVYLQFIRLENINANISKSTSILHQQEFNQINQIVFDKSLNQNISNITFKNSGVFLSNEKDKEKLSIVDIFDKETTNNFTDYVVNLKNNLENNKYFMQTSAQNINEKIKKELDKYDNNPNLYISLDNLFKNFYQNIPSNEQQTIKSKLISRLMRGYTNHLVYTNINPIDLIKYKGKRKLKV